MKHVPIGDKIMVRRIIDHGFGDIVSYTIIPPMSKSEHVIDVWTLSEFVKEIDDPKTTAHGEFNESQAQMLLEEIASLPIAAIRV